MTVIYKNKIYTQKKNLYTYHNGDITPHKRKKYIWDNTPTKKLTQKYAYFTHVTITKHTVPTHTIYSIHLKQYGQLDTHLTKHLNLTNHKFNTRTQVHHRHYDKI